MAKYQVGVIYILRDGFQIFAPGLPSILEFRFVPEIVRDLDLVNKELLYNLLKIFISDNKIPKSSFIMIIADSASIMKDFTAPPVQADQQPEQQAQLQKLANEFLEHIPFDEVSTKSIPVENGIRVYGTNKELYDSIKETFIQEGFEVTSVLPAIIIGPEISNKAALDAETISIILKKAPLMKEFNLLKQPTLSLQSEETQSENTETVKKEKKSDNKRTIILVAVFILLIIVLVIVYLTQPK